MRQPILYDDPPVIHGHSPGLRYTLRLNDQYLLDHPTSNPPEDTNEAYALLCQVQFKYQTGNCLMIRTEGEFNRWRHVKVIHSSGWWLLGCYVPIYVISHANGQVQNCHEDELWPLHDVLQANKPVEPKKVDSPRKKNNNQRSQKEMSELSQKMQKWKRWRPSAVDNSSTCSCAVGQCVHSGRFGPELGEDEIFEFDEEEVF